MRAAVEPDMRTPLQMRFPCGHPSHSVGAARPEMGGQSAAVLPATDRAIFRPRGLVRWVGRMGSTACVVLVSGCGTQAPPLVNPGKSDVRVEGRSLGTQDAAAPARWQRFDEAAAFPQVSPRFPSHGHFEGRWVAEAFADSASVKPYSALTWKTALPVGAVILEKLYDPSGRAAGPWFVMEKQAAGYFPAGGDWSYTVLDPQGSVEEEGRIALCARCHAEAVSDHLFGVPAVAHHP